MKLPEGMEWRGAGAKFVNDLCDGNGKLIWKNGDTYIGALKEGLRHGIGICRRANNEKYEGQYVEGYAEGRGEYTWQNGDKYVGEYKKGIKDGEGIYSWFNGRVKRRGLWKEG